MKNKRGSLDIQNYIFISLIAAMAFVAIILIKGEAFAGILDFGREVDCENSAWWDGDRGLKSVLKSIDSNDQTSAETIFLNDDCNLVSFSIRKPPGQVTYQGIQPREPTLCLCDISSDQCKAYDCIKLKNFDQINTEQFSTEALENYVALKIRKDDRTLRI